MDHTAVSDKYIVKVIKGGEMIEKTIRNEEYKKEKEQASRFLAKELIRIILSKRRENET